MDDFKGLERILLNKKWWIHHIPLLYRFRLVELNEYAMDLVKFLRETAIAAVSREYGYSVSIRSYKEFIVFHVREDRVEDEDGFPSKRFGTFFQRKCALTLYFPFGLKGNLHPPIGRDSFSNIKKSFCTKGQILLLRGDNDLILWVSKWIERRFQTNIKRTFIHITPRTMNHLARDFALDVLQQQQKISNILKKQPRSRSISPYYQAVQDEVDTGRIGGDNQVQQEEEEAVVVVHKEPQEHSTIKGPLVLKYTNKNPDALIQTYNLTLPWATLGRLLTIADSRTRLCTAPEIIEQAKQMYFHRLSVDPSAFELSIIDIKGHIIVYADGIIEILTLNDSLNPLLDRLIELFLLHAPSTNSKSSF